MLKVFILKLRKNLFCNLQIMEKKIIDTYKNHLASLPSKESAGIHIGMYLQWLINNDFVSIKLKMDFSRGVEQVKS